MNIAIVLVLTAVSIVGVLGNIIIIGSIIVYKQLRNYGNVYVINLAIADLITVGYIMPVGLLVSQMGSDLLISSPILCVCTALMNMVSLGVSTHSLMMIALERYIHICQQRLYHKLISRCTVTASITICWVYIFIWSSQMFTGWGQYAYGPNVYVCALKNGAHIRYALPYLVFYCRSS